MKTSALLPVALLLACSNTSNGPAGAGGSSGGDGVGSSGQGEPTGDATSGASGGVDTTASSSGSGGDPIGGSGETGDEPVHEFDFPALQPVNDGRFATSDACTDCHTADASSTAMTDLSTKLC